VGGGGDRDRAQGSLEVFRGGGAIIAPAICAADPSGLVLRPALGALAALLALLRREQRAAAARAAREEQRQRTLQALRPPPREPTPAERLRTELSAQRLSAIEKQAEAVGVDPQIRREALLDRDDPKLAMIEAVISCRYPQAQAEAEAARLAEAHARLSFVPPPVAPPPQEQEEEEEEETAAAAAAAPLPEADGSQDLLCHLASHHPLAALRTQAQGLLRTYHTSAASARRPPS
jgi:hypothetical protein